MTAWLTSRVRASRPHGFTLVELSIVLLLLGLLLGGLLSPLAAQRSQAELQAARQQMEEIREALTGFALANGRLPCPARPQLASENTMAGREDCLLQHGVIPWVSLALPANDPWGNRFTYYASERFTGELPADARASFTLDTLGNANIVDSGGKTLASDLPAVIVCHGRSAAGAFSGEGQRIAGAAGDEAENADADLTFVAHSPTPSFDDHVTWIIPSILKSRMVSGGRLP